MGFIDQMKKAANVAKLQGELMLIEREVTACKEKHGIAIYNVLSQRWHNTNNNTDDNNDTKEETELPLKGLEAAFQAAAEDLVPLNQKRNDIVDQLEMRALSSSSSQEATSKVSSFLGNAKLKTELAYYEREIKLRQGIFGHQVFDDLHVMTTTEQLDGTPFSESHEHYTVGEALNQAREEMSLVLKRKQDKEAEIAAAKAQQV